MRTLVAEAIQTRLNDPRIPRITSVTRVRVSEDLSVAQVSVSVLGSDEERQTCLKVLRSAAGRIRKLVAEELTLRKIPVLSFRLDDSVRGSAETVEAIDRAMRALGEAPEWEQAEASEEEAGDTTDGATDSSADDGAREDA